ncbi:efflux RND transporter periplasmic adaptor subunit [Blastococcus sp. LR1]|uniref:efflux RND transporter periplasmic adaptor subunit n=1 Tax=Blastococcus sp. LR1 TaxID=2877000 RepID=UPI001CCA0B4C|nr:efflux RND transporter periplasmic adaptor subunit [Blastococcus sp. LR1]MCA0146904.1 HlyD family efflux transporter periplasmic adaptor subunit [Blastococcus sp. LR1]
MGTVRTLVFPALRLLVWAVIAAALVVLAFRGGTDPAAGGPDAPMLDLTSPALPVARGTVANTVTVSGTVVADSPVPVRATAAGTVRRILAPQGRGVPPGQGLLEIRVEEQLQATTGTDAEGNPTVTPRPPRIRTVTVPAPAGGTVSSMEALVDQVVSVGDKLGEIAPGTLSVTATLTQAEQFRLLAPPATAEVTVEGGPAPFTCTGLTLGAAPAPTSGDTGNGDFMGPPTSGGTTATCAVPPGATVFAGMAATVAVNAGIAENVLVVPITAVQGSVQQGNVWVVGEDGSQEERPVALGLSDGDQVEVREGLAEGEQVLQFIPVPDDTVDDEMMGGPYG